MIIRLSFSILLVVVSGLIFFEFTDPLLGEIKELRQEISLLESGLNNAKKLREVQNRLLVAYNSLPPGDLERLDKLIPDRVDAVRFIIDVNAIAERSGMAIKNLQVKETVSESSPSPTGEEDFSPSPPDRTAAKTVAGRRTFALGFSVSGSYTNFQSFLNDLARSLRIMEVSSLTLVPNEKGDYDYGLELKTYWLK